MKAVWPVADCIVSPLGFTTEENFKNIRRGVSGVTLVEDTAFSNRSFWASHIKGLYQSNSATRFDEICLKAMEGVLHNINLPVDRSIFLLSTTKGNIELIDQRNERIHLYATAKSLAKTYGFKNYQVVSNACISGVLALIVGKRLIASGRFDHAVILGADVLSDFVISGFKSLQALSDEPCRPFDANRKGINLGEAAAAMVITAKPEEFNTRSKIQLKGAGISNDANHISGPSRTGEELASSIQSAIKNSGLNGNEIDFISAHGTATLYNDEMEAKAFSIAGMKSVPLNSLKGYYGHTLGAAGILETIIAIHSLLQDELIPTKGFAKLGVSQPVTVCDKLQSKPLKRILKTASGFGGCNAAIVIEKI